MRTLSAGDLLALWERGARLHPIDRSLAVLALALPERPWRDLVRLSLGERDSLLLEVRRTTLGDRIDAQDRCVMCGERVELQLACSTLAAASAPAAGEWTISAPRYQLTLRVLTSEDAAAAATCKSVAAARSLLLERGIVAAAVDDRVVAARDLPGHVLSAAAASLAEHDTRAEMVLDLTCPACHAQWQSVLDVARFVWTELAARARHIIGDVHTLARAYGWSEAEILGLTDMRRAAYLRLVSA